ncbi:MAG: hypothetical protein ACFB2X_05915 [Rivularia sp. (in: cyanobacteria)]
MAILTKSPWYQQILREGEAPGERRGIISGIEMALENKFGNEGLQLMSQISQITDLEKLKVIQRGIKTVNLLEELQRLINSAK